MQRPRLPFTKANIFRVLGWFHFLAGLPRRGPKGPLFGLGVSGKGHIGGVPGGIGNLRILSECSGKGDHRSAGSDGSAGHKTTHIAMLQCRIPLSVMLIAAFCFVPEVGAQAPVDIGLRSNDGRLEVLLRPGSDVGGIVSSVVFTLRWERATGAGLGELAQDGIMTEHVPIRPSGGVRGSGAYDYQVFAGFGTLPLNSSKTTWKATKEYVIASIPVNGTAEFELVNDAWTSEVTNNADFYLSVGGMDRTGSIYSGPVMVEGEGGVSIRPNPNDGRFSFSFDVLTASDVVVEVVNALGQVVFTDNVRDLKGTYRRDMDLSGPGSGVYYLKVKRGDRTSTHKVVHR